MDTQEPRMSISASSLETMKRLRPGKVSAKTSRHRAMPARPMGSPAQAMAPASVSTVMNGSRNAATKDVTDCGALKNVRL